MTIDRDGTYRPRWGTSWLTTLAGEIRHISRPGGYSAHVILVAGEELQRLHVETLAISSLGGGWPSTPLSHTVAVTSSGDNVWIACKTGVGGSAATLYKLSGAGPVAAIASPGTGNAVGMHGYFALKILSGATDNTALRWSDLGDVDTWPVTSAKQPVPEIRTIDYAVPFSQYETILFGPNGVASMTGVTADGMSFKPIANLSIVTPMYHVCKCRDAVYFLAAGWQIYRYRHPGIVERIDAPISRLLVESVGPSYLRSWYNPQTNCYVLWDRWNYRGYNFSIDQQRWIGVTTYGVASTNMQGYAHIDQGASTFDETSMPWGKGFLGAGSRVVQEDPSEYVDITSASTSSTFDCAIETKPSTGADASIEKQIHEVGIDGTGSWTVKLKYRSGPDASWSTATLGTVSAPGKVYPSLDNMPAYRERVIRCEAESDPGLRWRSVSIDERPVGMPY